MRPSIMPDARALVTAEELPGFQVDDSRYELVDGRVVRMNPPGGRHGSLALTVGRLLDSHVRAKGLGVVMVESGYTLARNPDTVRGPDVSFVRRERVPAEGLPVGFWEGAPDLAVEVASPHNRGAELGAKVSAYLTAGAIVVLVVDPDAESVTIHRRLAAPLTLEGEENIDLYAVVPGFRCSVNELFR